MHCGFAISMSRQGNPYDNAVAESFFKTLKNEEVYLTEHRTAEEAQTSIRHFIDQVNNQKRLHSSLGHVPPVEYELQYKQTALIPA
jgi:transposase InsO family protein